MYRYFSVKFFRSCCNLGYKPAGVRKIFKINCLVVDPVGKELPCVSGCGKLVRVFHQAVHRIKQLGTRAQRSVCQQVHNI